MKLNSMVLALSALVLFGACQSEIADKPAAEVSDTATTATMDIAPQPPHGAAVKHNVIKEKSSINFVGAKVTRDHKGQFKNFDGTIDYANAAPTGVSFNIDLASIETDTPDLTAHLKTADFFDVAQFPTATFVSTSLTPAPAGAAAGTTHELKGNLTMHGMTREVTIPVTTQTTPEGVRATSEFTINRHDWGISYKGMADDLIKDNVLIKLDLLFPPAPTV